MWLGRILAILIFGGLAVSIFDRWLLIAGVVLLSLWIIRLLADLFWWGRDNRKW